MCVCVCVCVRVHVCACVQLVTCKKLIIRRKIDKKDDGEIILCASPHKICILLVKHFYLHKKPSINKLFAARERERERERERLMIYQFLRQWKMFALYLWNLPRGSIMPGDIIHVSKNTSFIDIFSIFYPQKLSGKMGF